MITTDFEFNHCLALSASLPTLSACQFQNLLDSDVLGAVSNMTLGFADCASFREAHWTVGLISNNIYRVEKC